MMMRLKTILIIAFLFLSPLHSFAFEEASYRIQALGEEFAGIVEDEYTDLFLNPAYIGRIKDKRLYGKFGHKYASPFSLTYIKKMGVFSENYVSKTESEREDEGLETYGWQNLWRKYISKRRGENNTSQDDFGLIYGKKFGRNKYLGVKYNYKEDAGNNLSKYNYTNLYIDPSENKTVYIYEREEKNATHSSLYSNYFTLGIILPDIEIIGNYTLSKDKSKSINKDYTLNDEDPDGDGKNYQGSNWVDKYSSLSEEIAKEDKELSTNYDINMNFSRKYVIGINCQKYDITGDETKSCEGLNIRKEPRWVEGEDIDVTLTTISTTNEIIPTITGYQKNKSAFIKFGNEKRLSKNIIVAYCLRLGGDITKTYKTGNKEVTTSFEYTDSQDEEQNKKTDIHYNSRETEDIRAENYSISLPIGIEKEISDELTLRLGMKKLFSVNKTRTKEAEEKGEVERTIITSEGVTTEILEPEVTTSSSEIKNSSISTYYSFGLCYKITDRFRIEFVSFSEILDLSSWKIQTCYRF